uniref:Uncharacterized protein n=1 Tax=Anopheles arabiensis TaxID=7173 RepID=A0A182I5H2_ANOAR
MSAIVLPPCVDGKYMVLPSGELHIREVGPEDGYKSYQCRTKHRLTGETRLSATKGRLVITEPLASVAPRLTSGDKSRNVDIREAHNITLLCPAQSFPVPAFRTYWQRCTTAYVRRCDASAGGTGHRQRHTALPGTIISGSCLSLCTPISQHLEKECPKIVDVITNYTNHCLFWGYSTEPVGSVAPRLTSGDESRKLLVQRDANVTMLCPAQSFPVPVFSKKIWMERRMNSNVVFFCPAQAYPVASFSKSPSFSNDAVTVAVKAARNTSIALTCQAQAFPVPVFR